MRDEERWEAADEGSLAGPPLTSCCAAWFLTGLGLVPVCGLGVGDPCSKPNTGKSSSVVAVKNLYHPVPTPTPARTWNCRSLLEWFSDVMQANLPPWEGAPSTTSLTVQSLLDYPSGIRSSLLNEESLIVLRKFFLN